MGVLNREQKNAPLMDFADEVPVPLECEVTARSPLLGLPTDDPLEKAPIVGGHAPDHQAQAPAPLPEPEDWGAAHRASTSASSLSSSMEFSDEQHPQQESEGGGAQFSRGSTLLS